MKEMQISLPPFKGRCIELAKVVQVPPPRMPGNPFSVLSLKKKRYYASRALAVLEALQEADDKQMIAAERCIRKRGLTINTLDARAIYRAMIIAAIEGW